MNDVKREFGHLGIQNTANPYAHPQAASIMEECRAMLLMIPEGRRLLAFAHDNHVALHIITGREPAFRVGDDNTAFLICPATTAAVDLHVAACNLACAIRAAEHASIGIARPDYANPTADLPRITFEHFLDIIYETCIIAHEFEVEHKSTKLVDFVEKLGHSKIYREVSSGRSKQEVAPLLAEIMKY